MESIFGVGSEQSLPSQYLHYLGDIFTGTSARRSSISPSPVSQVVRHRDLLDARPRRRHDILAFALGTGIGILSGLAARRAADSVVPPIFVMLPRSRTSGRD